MKIRDLFTLSMRSFKTRPMRTSLTILGMGVGIGAILFLVSFGYGLQQGILGQITTADSLLSLDVSPGTSGLIQLDNKSLENISAIPEVTEISPVVSQPGQLTTNDITGDAAIYAVDNSFFRLSGLRTSSGDSFSEAEPRGVVISSIGAKIFNFENEEDIIGKEIYLSLFITRVLEDDIEEVELVQIEQPYKVIGIINDENANYAYIPLDTLGNLEFSSYDSLKVKVADNIYMENVRNQIIDQGFLVSSLSDTIEQANKIFGIVQIVLGLFGLIALIVSAIGMFNTMTITLLERINEIGIMRSIGVTKRDIRYLFLFESMVIGFLGGLSGIIIGFLGGELVNIFFNLLAKNFGGQIFDLFVSPTWFIFFILIFSTVIGFITGIYPSKQAASLNPLEALRYK